MYITVPIYKYMLIYKCNLKKLFVSQIIKYQ